MSARETIEVLEQGLSLHGEPRDVGYRCEYPAMAANRLAIQGRVRIVDEANEQLAASLEDDETDETRNESSDSDETANNEADNTGEVDKTESDTSDDVQRIRDVLESGDYGAMQSLVGELTDVAVVGASKDDLVEVLESELEARQ